MNWKKTIALVLSTAVSVFALSVHAFSQEWVNIAEKTVNFKADKDMVTPQGQEKQVDKIRIKCIQGTLKLKQVAVEMSDGQRKEFDAKGIGVLSNGMRSLAWDLPGKGKEVKLKKIELMYDAVGNVLVSQKAKIIIEGRKSKT